MMKVNMVDFGKFKFIREGGERTITFELSGQSSLDEMCENFEYFLLASGYTLPKGAHIGYEYDDVDAGGVI